MADPRSDVSAEALDAFGSRVAAAAGDFGNVLRQIDERIAAAAQDPAQARELGEFIGLHFLNSQIAALEAARLHAGVPAAAIPVLREIFLRGLVLGNTTAGSA